MRYSYRVVEAGEITALDLSWEVRELAEGYWDFECAVAQVGEVADAVQILFVADTGRLGWAWGAPATWVDASSIGEFLEQECGCKGG